MSARGSRKASVEVLRRLVEGDLGGLDLNVGRLRAQLTEALATLGGGVRPTPRRQVPLWGVGLAIAVGGVACLLLWRSRHQLQRQLKELKETVPPELGQAVQRGKQAVEEAVQQLPSAAEEVQRTVRRAQGRTKRPPTG